MISGAREGTGGFVVHAVPIVHPPDAGPALGARVRGHSTPAAPNRSGQPSDGRGPATPSFHLRAAGLPAYYPDVKGPDQ